MAFNYFKVVTKVFRPVNDHTAEIVRMVRSANQHSHAISREITANVLRAKKDLEPIVPGIELDPFRNVGIKQEAPLSMNKNSVSGVSLLEHSILERRRIVRRKLDENKKSKAFYN